MNRWRFEAGILSVAAGCQAVTVSGEPLPVHVARLPGLHANRWSETEGDEPCRFGASVHPAHGPPSCGGAVCPLVVPTLMGGGPTVYQGCRSGPGTGRWSQR